MKRENIERIQAAADRRIRQLEPAPDVEFIIGHIPLFAQSALMLLENLASFNKQFTPHDAAQAKLKETFNGIVLTQGEIIRGLEQLGEKLQAGVEIHAKMYDRDSSPPPGTPGD